MLSRFYILIILCFLQNCVLAQKQANSWYFGARIGLNFNINPPQKLTNGNLLAIEGCASIADANGNLLFYTNGITIMNKLHSPMVNGGGIMGDLSSTNNAVIVPLPETDSIYYLFTVGAAGQLDKGLRYSIINMKKQNGLGEVVEKNTLLYGNCFEKIAAVRHCNRKDVWITVKDWGSDIYNSYLLTNNGVNPSAVLSSMGTQIMGNSLNSLGTLKFSSDGRKLIALHAFENDIAQLMNFDNATGTLSDPVLFRPNTLAPSGSLVGVYGAAFSPDNRMLYISSRRNGAEKSVIYQFNITSHDAISILNSNYVVASNSDWDGGGLQTGPDGKIYFSQFNNNALSIIANPENAGGACNYQNNAIDFSPALEPVQFGLPNFIASDLDSNYSAFDFSWHQPGGCTDLSTQFTPTGTSGVDSIKWSISDGSNYNINSPLHTFLLPGSYTVQMEVFRQSCNSLSQIVTHTLIIGGTTLSAFLPADTTFCITGNISHTISPLSAFSSYLWNTGATSKQITIQLPGVYWLEVSQDGCTFRDSITISQVNSTQVNIGDDKAVCVNKPVQLIATDNSAVAYRWSTGSTASTIEVNMPGTYWVEVRNANGCVTSDTLKTYWGDCDIYIPSAFSPNADGKNETFGLVNGISSTVFTFYIYNRYGQLLFTTNDPLKKWDGNFKGKPSPNGAYIWMISYKNKEGFIQHDKGTVMIIR